jgi:TRAP-type mannitol/chloroaromatic compound transport system permease small subunit
MRAMRRILKVIDGISKTQSYVMAIVLTVLVFLVVFEVIMRYVFNAPTIWGTEFQLFLYAGLFMLSQAYTLYRGSHARVDILVRNLPCRAQDAIAAICYLLLFLPFACVVLRYGISFAYDSWVKHETSVWSGWQPIIYPVKTIIPIGAFMLLLQGLAEMVRHILNIFGVETNEQ